MIRLLKKKTQSHKPKMVLPKKLTALLKKQNKTKTRLKNYKKFSVNIMEV